MAQASANWGWTGSNYYEVLYFDVSRTETDNLGNRSRFRIRVWNDSNNSYGDTGAIELEVKRGSTSVRTKSLRNQKTTGYNQEIQYDDYYLWVPHNANGTLANQTFTLAITRALGNVKSASLSVTVTNIPTIPRQSIISTFNNFTLGSNIAWAVTRYLASYTHKVELLVGSTVIASMNSIAASGTLSINAAAKTTLLGLLSKTSKSLTATLRVTTYTNSNYNVQVGSSETKTAQGTANDADIAPTFTSISHSEYVADVATKVGAYVKDKSRLSLAINGAAGKYGATISSYRLTIAGQTINAQSGTTALIGQSGTLKLTGRIVDSRGIAVTADVDINVLDYVAPKIEGVRFIRSLSNSVENPYGEYVLVVFKATIQSLKVGSVEKNGLTTKILSKQSQQTSYTERNSTNQTALTVNVFLLLSGYQVDYSFDFIARAVDIFETASVPGIVAIGEVLMQWAKNQVSIGMMIPDTNHAFYLPESGMLNLGPYIDKNGNEVLAPADYVVETGENANGKWEKWKSGKLIQYDMIKDFTLGNEYYQLGEYPIPFYGVPSCSMSIGPYPVSGNSYSFLGKIGQVKVISFDASNFAIFTRNTPTGTEIGRARVSAIGRWK